MLFKAAILMRNGIAQAAQELRRDDIHYIADMIHSQIKPEPPISNDKLIKIKDVSDLGFTEGELIIEEYSQKTYTILGDADISPKKEVIFASVKSNTPKQTLSIKEGKLSTILKNLPYITKEANSIVFDMENQTVIRGHSTLYAVMTLDEDYKVDGLLFTFEIDTEEIEAHTSISYPGGSREGVPKKMTMQKITTIHLKGIAETDGPLSSGKISLPEYLNKVSKNENFKKAKRYFMKVDLGDYPLLSSLVS